MSFDVKCEFATKVVRLISNQGSGSGPLQKYKSGTGILVVSMVPSRLCVLALNNPI